MTKMHDVVIQMETCGDLHRCAIYVDGVLFQHSPPTKDEAQAKADFDTARVIAEGIKEGKEPVEGSKRLDN